MGNKYISNISKWQYKIYLGNIYLYIYLVPIGPHVNFEIYFILPIEIYSKHIHFFCMGVSKPDNLKIQ